MVVQRDNDLIIFLKNISQTFQYALPLLSRQSLGFLATWGGSVVVKRAGSSDSGPQVLVPALPISGSAILRKSPPLTQLQFSNLYNRPEDLKVSVANTVLFLVL